MKKVLLIMFALICFGATAKAQVCKISGSNDNVEVFNCYTDVENNQVIVIVSNDSNDISANVTVTVEVKMGSVTKTVEGKARALPNQNTKIEIPMSREGVKIGSTTTVRCTKITGAKCL